MSIARLLRVFSVRASCIASIVAAAGCVAVETDEPTLEAADAIINGTILNAENSGFPIVNALDASCSSTLITNEWLLTSRYCIADEDESSPGSIHVNMGSQSRVATRVVRHPARAVALVRLDAPFSMNGSTSGYEAAFYTGSMAALAGKNVNCSGYGSNTFTGGTGALRTAILEVSSATDDTVKVAGSPDEQALWQGDIGTGCVYNVLNGAPSIIGVLTSITGDANTAAVAGNHVGIAAIREWIASVLLGGKFGSVVATGDFDGDSRVDLAVSAPEDGASGTGVVHVFRGTATGIVPWMDLDQSDLAANQTGELFGAGLAAGDFDGDGRDDLAVGTPGSGAGRVRVFQGSVAGLVPWTWHDQTGLGTNEAGDLLGAALAAGDFDGDGRDDLAIGAPGKSLGAEKSGAVFAFRGGAAGLSAWHMFGQRTLDGDEAGDQVGAALAAGDFDGDGKDDLAVGAPGEKPGTKQSGAAFVYRGTAAGLADWKRLLQDPFSANELSDLFGASLATGDFNGDGKDDLAVGAPSEALSDTDPRAGAVFVFQGTTSADGPTAWKALKQQGVSSQEVGDFFGAALASGDFNGDGNDDLAVGAPGEALIAIESGNVRLFKGGTTGPTAWVSVVQTGLDADEAGDFFGAAMAAADFDNDGRADLAVGAPGEVVSGAKDGYTFVFKGATTGTTPWLGLSK